MKPKQIIFIAPVLAATFVTACSKPINYVLNIDETSYPISVWEIDGTDGNGNVQLSKKKVEGTLEPLTRVICDTSSETVTRYSTDYQPIKEPVKGYVEAEFIRYANVPKKVLEKGKDAIKRYLQREKLKGEELQKEDLSCVGEVNQN